MPFSFRSATACSTRACRSEVAVGIMARSLDPRMRRARGRGLLLALMTVSALSVVFSVFLDSAAQRHRREGYQTAITIRARVTSHAGAILNNDESKLPSVDEYVARECKAVNKTFAKLIDHSLRHWRGNGMSHLGISNTSLQYIYILDNQLHMSKGTQRRKLMPSYFRLLKQLRLKALLPNLMLPFNPDDNPVEHLGRLPVPTLSFCSTPEYADILFPNVIEGDVIEQDKVLEYSTRGLHRAVFRGTTDAHQGWPKGRNALLRLGLERPDLIDSGLSRWSDDVMNGSLPDKRLLKPSISFEEQAAMYRYLVWAPGNCASVRLALQLSADALVFKINSLEGEWYYPLLKPFVHYIPLEANDTHVNLEQRILWARQHPHEVAAITQAARAFAKVYLSPSGRDCYALQLLQQLHDLTNEPVTLPKWSVRVSDCNKLDQCREPAWFTLYFCKTFRLC